MTRRKGDLLKRDTLCWGNFRESPRQIDTSCDVYWTRPMEGRFENDTAYAMG